MARDAYNARTVADIRRISERENIFVLADLKDRLRAPASKWTYDHLVAYQLQIGSENEVLETFAPDYSLYCPILHPENSPQRVNPDMIQALSREISLNELLAPESELLRTSHGREPRVPDPLGPFKVALAQARNVTQVSPRRDHPEREKKAVERDNMVNSSVAIDGSSSPQQPSSEDFERGESEIDDDTSEERRGIQEEVAVRLLVEFTRYVLQYCLEQPNAAKVEIRPRIERWRSTALVGDAESSGQDDGGIARFRRVDEGWAVDHAYLASFEVKRAQMLHEFYRSNKYGPIVSNSTMAQNLGEAVLGWRANQYLLGQEFSSLSTDSYFMLWLTEWP